MDYNKGKRPFLIRAIPPFLRVGLALRWFRNKPHSDLLYKDSILWYNSKIKMDLVRGDVISDAIALTGIYDYKKTKSLITIAKTGGLFLDVGANLGYFSLLWAGLDPLNQVISFEVSPRNVELIKQNINKNFLDKQITLIDKAVGQVKGNLEFDVGDESQTGWGGFTNTKNENSINVEVITLDDVLYGINQEINLLKIDIEGADFWALKGCEKFLKEKMIKNIWFEQNKPRSRALGIPDNAALDLLNSLGYRLVPDGDLNADTLDWIAIS
jgi:FkbM family methyltransferase